MNGGWPDVDRRANDRRAGDRRRIDRRAEVRAATHTRTFVALFAMVAIFIVYASLYPFQWVDRGDDRGAVVYLLSTAGDWNRPVHLIPSILFYIPFGLLSMFALPPRMMAQSRVMLALGGGILFSVWMELAQFQDAGHETTMGDVYASSLGLVLGIAAALMGQSGRLAGMRETVAWRVPVALLIMWAGDRLHPYVPTTGGPNLWQAVAPLADWSNIDPLTVARAGARWLIVACLVDVLFGPRRWFHFFPLLIIMESVVRLALAGRVLTLTDLGGAASALIIWPFLRRLPASRFVLVIAFAALIVVVRLSSFPFVGLPGTFGWLPFKSMMNATTTDNLRAFFSDGFLYGGMIWLLTTSGLGLGAATTLTATGLLCVSVAQTWQAGPPGEITDAVVAVMVGAVLALLRDDPARPPARHADAPTPV